MSMTDGSLEVKLARVEGEMVRAKAAFVGASTREEVVYRHEFVSRVNFLVTGVVRSAALTTAASFEQVAHSLSGAVTEDSMGRDVVIELFDEEEYGTFPRAQPISSIYSRDRAVKTNITSA